MLSSSSIYIIIDPLNLIGRGLAFLLMLNSVCPCFTVLWINTLIHASATSSSETKTSHVSFCLPGAGFPVTVSEGTCKIHPVLGWTWTNCLKNISDVSCMKFMSGLVWQIYSFLWSRFYHCRSAPFLWKLLPPIAEPHCNMQSDKNQILDLLLCFYAVATTYKQRNKSRILFKSD
jgi:hypothetical protein